MTRHVTASYGMKTGIGGRDKWASSGQGKAVPWAEGRREMIFSGGRHARQHLAVVIKRGFSARERKREADSYPGGRPPCHTTPASVVLLWHSLYMLILLEGRYETYAFIFHTAIISPPHRYSPYATLASVDCATLNNALSRMPLAAVTT